MSRSLTDGERETLWIMQQESEGPARRRRRGIFVGMFEGGRYQVVRQQDGNDRSSGALALIGPFRTLHAANLCAMPHGPTLQTVADFEREAKRQRAAAPRFAIGTRVALHAACSEWAQGDRFGNVTGFGKLRAYVCSADRAVTWARPIWVKLDSGRVRRFHPSNLFEVQS